MQKSERVNFGSKIGAVLAAAGSAVGLGNIWRFPYETEINRESASIYLSILGVCFYVGNAYYDCRIHSRSSFKSKYGTCL